MVSGYLKYRNGQWGLENGEDWEVLDLRKSVDMQAGESWRKCRLVPHGEDILVDGEVELTPELAGELEITLRQYEWPKIS